MIHFLSHTHLKVKRLGSLMLFLLLLVITNVPSNAQLLDNKGKDFIMGFMPNFSGNFTELHLSSDVSTNVTVEYPVNSPTFTTTVAVNPGTITVVEIPVTSAQSWVANTVANNAVHAFASKEFVCYMINRRPFSTDAALALPVDVMNKEYIATTYNAAFGGGEFLVVAAFNNTKVTITPKNAAIGHPAGTAFSVTLDRGEGYLVQSLASAGAAGSLMGSIITSDKPVGLTSGNICTQIPYGIVACDHIFEVGQPVQSWGNKVFVNNLPLRDNGSIYRIVASEDNTKITQDGSTIGTIDRGDFIETDFLKDSHVFEGNKPIYVVQFMPGVGNPGTHNTGDPAMGNMIPSEQYLSAYTFATVGAGQFSDNFVSIIAHNDDVGSLKLDGTTIPSGDYSAIPGTDYSAALKSIKEGTHTTSSSKGHGITVEGYNSADSYIYPGGARFQFINPRGDANPPLCQLILAGDKKSADGKTTDNRPTEDTNGNGILDPGEDLNSNGQIDEDTGIFFVVLSDTSVNLVLTVDPFTPGDGMVTFQVTLADPNQVGHGSVVVTDGAGNKCVLPVQLGEGIVVVDPFPFMTFWAVNDASNGKLYWYTLTQGLDFSNVEGDILGIDGEKDIEDLAVDPNGTIYLVNNVGTSKIYMIAGSELDKNPATPVNATLIGNTGLPAGDLGGGIESGEEIASLHFGADGLYGIGKETQKVYMINLTDASLTEIGTLGVADFRTDGLTQGADENWYLTKTGLNNMESELWKFDSFPAGPISFVTAITTSKKIESLTSHPNGNLYAADSTDLYEVDLVRSNNRQTL